MLRLTNVPRSRQTDNSPANRASPAHQALDSQNFPPFYSVTNSTEATPRFSANHKTSLEQKNRSSFISDQIQMR